MVWKHNKAYDTPEYREARKRVLAAAKSCALGYAGCTKVPTEADHRDGIAADPEHKTLQAVCAPCHDVKTAAERRAAVSGKRAAWRPECARVDRLMKVGGQVELVHLDDVAHGSGMPRYHPSGNSSAIPIRPVTDWVGGVQRVGGWTTAESDVVDGKGSGLRSGSV